jgi:hypothetical protein
MIPVQIFTTWTPAQGYIGITTTGMIMWGVLYYLPIYYQGVLGYSAIIGAVGLLPITVIFTPVAVVTGILITKTGKYRIFLWIGWVIAVLGIGLTVDLKEGTSIVQWIFITIWSPVGMGMLLSALAICVQASARDEDMAFAAAMNPWLRAIGQTIGLAVFGSVFSNTVQK